MCAQTSYRLICAMNVMSPITGSEIIGFDPLRVETLVGVVGDVVRSIKSFFRHARAKHSHWLANRPGL